MRCPKPETRLERRARRDRTGRQRDVVLKRAVWDRDEGRCRVCGVRCLRLLTLHPRRGEVHHLEGRLRLTRYEPRCAILVCATCHEKLTRHRLWALGSLWEVDGAEVLDANASLTFEVMP